MEVVAILNYAGAALAFALAVVVARRPSRVARRVVLVLFLTAAMAFGWEIELPAGPATAAQYALLALVMNALAVCYLALFAELPTPLARPLRSRGGRVTIALLAVLFTLLPFAMLVATRGADPDDVLATVGPTTLLHAAALLYALAVSVSAWRRAERGTPARERAAAWALALGVRDGGVGLGLAMLLLGEPALGASFGGAVSDAGSFLVAFAGLAHLPLLAYGILRTQLFDLDLRLKRGVRRGTLAAIVLGAILADALLFGALLGSAFGYAAGALAAGALVALAIVPLSRFSERVADLLLPRAESPERLAERRDAVQRAAIEDAFEIERELGRGAHGRALLARDRLLGRRVVLKEPLVANAPGARERVLAEARAAARLRHPNVVTVHQVIDVATPVIVFEHVEGEPLSELLAKRAPLTADEAARIALDVLAGLSALHAAGIVHRDVKPSNVLLDARGQPKLADFGIALASGEAAAERAGSPRYMSPEQARGLPVDARSDLFSVGVLLHEALTGKPFAGAEATADYTVGRPGAPARVDGPLAGVVARALARDPASRYPGADAMAAAIRDALARA